MGIRKAVGLGITIIILKFLLSAPFGSFEIAMTSLFNKADVLINTAHIETLIASPTISGLSH